MVTGYPLAKTVSTALVAKFGDLFGRKRMFLASVIVFLVGSVLCGFATSMTPGRARLGVRRGHRDRRAAGGLFVAHLSWRWAFYVNIPVGLVVIAVAVPAIPAVRAALQYVQGTSATTSAIRMLPMALGLLIAAIGNGNVVSRTGRYLAFPVAGSVGMAVGLYLLSTMDEHTRLWPVSASVFLLGVGVGLTMRVLLIAAQNTVDHADLGVATSGVTFLRTIGSSFCVAVFGSGNSGELGHRLAEALVARPLPAGPTRGSCRAGGRRRAGRRPPRCCARRSTSHRRWLRRRGRRPAAPHRLGGTGIRHARRRLPGLGRRAARRLEPGAPDELPAALTRPARRLFDEEPAEPMPVGVG